MSKLSSGKNTKNISKCHQLNFLPSLLTIKKSVHVVCCRKQKHLLFVNSRVGVLLPFIVPILIVSNTAQSFYTKLAG